jgi:nucleoside-diphosphate-sugar epimerase
MVVAVTGACGFIGAALCERLRAEGDRVIGADAVVHAAALVAERGRMEEFVRVNVRGTRNVLDAAGPRRAVVIASVAGWGYEFRRELREDAPPRPCGLPYVDTKGATETLALRRGATVIRPGDVYGPGSTPWVVRPLEMMRAGRFFLPSPGDGVMTLVYVDDLVDAIVRALREPRAAGRAYTVWDGSLVPAREYFERLGGRPVRTLPAAVLRAAARAMGMGPAAVTFVTRQAAYPNERARAELGWRPSMSLDDGMARTREWARAAGLLDR